VLERSGDRWPGTNPPHRYRGRRAKCRRPRSNLRQTRRSAGVLFFLGSLRCWILLKFEKRKTRRCGPCGVNGAVGARINLFGSLVCYFFRISARSAPKSANRRGHRSSQAARPISTIASCDPKATITLPHGQVPGVLSRAGQFCCALNLPACPMLRGLFSATLTYFGGPTKEVDGRQWRCEPGLKRAEAAASALKKLRASGSGR